MLPSGSTRSGSSVSRATSAPPSSRSPTAAEVSPATFFRYFPTKEDVVLQDDIDTRMVEAFERSRPGSARSPPFRGAIRRRRPHRGRPRRDPGDHELTMTVPEIRARAMDEFARTIDGDQRGPGQAGRAPGRRPRGTNRGRRDHRRHHGHHHAVGRLVQRRQASWTCSSASTRPWACWRPASRCERPRARGRFHPRRHRFSARRRQLSVALGEETDFCHASLTRLGAAPRGNRHDVTLMRL